ncbi:ABC transporter permease/substrate-binding protein [Runella aurantiaca]|uniref:ABC transporter permease subunit n=1 Tax=Runella aurantiaca TaxID=2282308 RepID=A0A369HYF9_9BACT|nr:ABC transporter permease/substrate-binding protein [Runella aurantiaca]RDB02571.1 ABC transporter permease subunit [Runella aurantiaca]
MIESQSLWAFIASQWQKLLEQALQHLGLTFMALIIAIAVGLPLGIFITKQKKWATPILGIAGILQTIPSIALLGFLIPLLGIGAKPAIAALFLYALLPIIRNTYTGITIVDAEIKEAAKGLGMTSMQILTKIELPLALPVILAGIRTAAIINVGVATLAAYIAAGGLGEYIFGGIALNNTNMILAGALPAALLALLLDGFFYLLQKIQITKRSIYGIVAGAIMVISLVSFQNIHTAEGSLAGFEPEFMGRQDGYLGLKSVYNFKMRTVVIGDAVMYGALNEHKLDVIGGYSTDGRLKAFGLRTLEDDKRIFPPYYAAPLVRTSKLKSYPELNTVLNLLAGKINDSVMTELNYKADFLKQSPERVAKDFLLQQGLWKEPQPTTAGSFVIGSKIFTEQYILAQLYAMLVAGYTHLKPEMKTGLGGTKICYDALRNGNIDMYPEYTGTGLLVILKPTQSVLNRLNGNRDSVYRYVEENFRKTQQLTWLKPIGFNNTYALMMREKDAARLNITTISQLNKLN